MNRIFSIIWPLLFVAVSLQAGSYFSSQSNGLGLRRYTTNVRGIGMGVAGLASLDSLALNTYVTSSWRHITDTRFMAALDYQRNDLEVGSASFNNSTGGFAGLSFAIPIAKGKWSFGASLQPYTEVNFRSIQSEESNGVKFDQINLFSGSITRAQVVLAWAPIPSLGLSASGNFYFGQLEDRFEFRFDDASFFDASHSVDYKITGAGVGLSADFRPGPSLLLAGFVDFKPTTKLTVDYVSVVPINEPAQRNFDSFPLQFGLGGALQLNRRWVLVSDFSYQYWSEALKTAGGSYEDWYYIGGGLERRAQRGRHEGFLNKIDLRTGFSATRLGYRFNNQSVFEYALHAGVGVPFGRFHNRVDIALSAGLRGDSGKNLAREKFVGLNLSVALGELWFQQIR